MQKYIHDKNAKWDEKRFVAVNKDNTISEADYKIYVPKRKNRNNTTMDGHNGKDESDKKGKASDNFVAAVTDRGVIIQKPDYLSTFTVDKDKIDFYKQA